MNEINETEDHQTFHYSDVKESRRASTPRVGNIVVNPRRGGEWIVMDIKDEAINIENIHTKETDVVKSCAKLIANKELLIACGFEDNGEHFVINNKNESLLIDKTQISDRNSLPIINEDVFFHYVQNIYYYLFGAELNVIGAINMMVEYREKK